MTDILQQIDEELQRERMLALWDKHKKAVYAAVAALILGTAAWSAYDNHRVTTATKQTGALVALSDEGAKPGTQVEGLTAFAREFAGSGPAQLAQLRAAAAQIQSGDKAAALRTLDALAQDRKALPALRDYAALIWAQTQIDDGDVVALRARLEPLAVKNAPWQASARELLALLTARMGNMAAARDQFRALAGDETVPAGTRERANDLAQYYATQVK